MKLDPTDAGFTIAAEDLGALLNLPPPQVQALMRDGKITSRYEKGEGPDAGKHRVTFFHGRIKLRLTVDDTGTVLSRSRIERPNL